MEKLEDFTILKKIMRMRQALQSFFNDTSLKYGEYLILKYLINNQERANYNIDIATFLNFPAPAVTRILNSLEASSYITRSINPNDRRSITIVLTNKGTLAYQLTQTKITNFINGLLQTHNIAELKLLVSLIDDITTYCETNTKDV